MRARDLTDTVSGRERGLFCSHQLLIVTREFIDGCMRASSVAMRGLGKRAWYESDICFSSSAERMVSQMHCRIRHVPACSFVGQRELVEEEWHVKAIGNVREGKCI